MIKITRTELEGFFCMEAEGEWNEQTAMDFAELTEGDIVAVSSDIVRELQEVSTWKNQNS